MHVFEKMPHKMCLAGKTKQKTDNSGWTEFHVTKCETDCWLRSNRSAHAAKPMKAFQCKIAFCQLDI